MSFPLVNAKNTFDMCSFIRTRSTKIREFNIFIDLKSENEPGAKNDYDMSPLQIYSQLKKWTYQTWEIDSLKYLLKGKILIEFLSIEI